MAEHENGERRPLDERPGRRRSSGLRFQRRYVARRGRNGDAYTALIATLIGLLALVVSGYTAYVQRQQLRAQVWPYVVIDTANVPPFVGFHAVNSGTGPARVIAVGVQVDKQFVGDWAHADPAVANNTVRTVVSQLSNTVLPAGKDVTFFGPYEAASEPFIALFLGKQHAIRVTVCYCSVLEDCWSGSSDTVPIAIADADACPIAKAERFTQ